MFDPRPRQRAAIDFALGRTHCAWWLQMGAGKTVCALSVARQWLNSLDVRSVLVVAPKRVAEETWPGEVSKWPHLSDLRVVQIAGTPAQRLAAAQRDADIHVIGVQNLPWLVTEMRSRWAWSGLIFDESSGVKRAGTERFKALRKIQHEFARVLLLTGTPRPNSLLELWPQIWLLDRGTRLGASLGRYRARWFDRDWSGYKWTPKPGADAEIHTLLEDVCIALDSDADLPDAEIRTEAVALPHDIMTGYRQFVRDKVAQVIGSGGAITAANAAVLVGKLSQYANGVIYDDQQVPREVHGRKLERCAELVAEHHEPVVIAYWFRSDLARLKRKFPQAVDLSTAGSVEKWNRGEIPVLLLHPASAGHGLNLQFGGRRMIWFGPIWSLELWQQTIARLHRTGQTRPVVVHVLTATGTVDDLIAQTLRSKGTSQDATLRALAGQVRKAA